MIRGLTGELTLRVPAVDSHTLDALAPMPDGFVRSDTRSFARGSARFGAAAQMDSLESVSSLTIGGNPKLLTLHGLPSLSKADTFFITNNPKLPQCEVDAINQRVNACGTCNENDTTATCN